ncbi:apolipoprotein L3-like [Engraulis encrasicolus]|uniref:apolipoprotein L3-like n=1 Tax=Engraulis encrasicolus TaxID=184585 RepID=UPI002FD19BCF
MKDLLQDARPIKTFLNENLQDVKKKIRELTQITDELEGMHRSTTIGSLAGGVMGAAGGITTLAGLFLAPFTFGGSLIVSGIGIGVAATGGITGAASNITKATQSNTLQNKIKDILDYCETVLKPVLESLNKVHSTVDSLQTVVGAGRVLSGIGQIARLSVQAAKAAGVVGRTIPILSSLTLVLDVFTIASDAREIHQIRKREKGESVDSQMLKFIDEMKQAAAALTAAVEEIEKMRDAIDLAVGM